MGTLEAEIIRHLDADVIEQTLTLSQRDYPIIAQIHELAEVIEKLYDADGVTLRFRMNRLHAARLKKILARRSS